MFIGIPTICMHFSTRWNKAIINKRKKDFQTLSNETAYNFYVPQKRKKNNKKKKKKKTGIGWYCKAATKHVATR